MSSFTTTATRAIFAAAIGIAPFEAFAETYRWIGGNSGNWSAAANWTPSGVPGTGDSAAITNRTSMTTVLLDVDTFALTDAASTSRAMYKLTIGTNVTVNLNGHDLMTRNFLGALGSFITNTSATVNSVLLGCDNNPSTVISSSTAAASDPYTKFQGAIRIYIFGNKTYAINFTTANTHSGGTVLTGDGQKLKGEQTSFSSYFGTGDLYLGDSRFGHGGFTFYKKDVSPIPSGRIVHVTGTGNQISSACTVDKLTNDSADIGGNFSGSGEIIYACENMNYNIYCSRLAGDWGNFTGTLTAKPSNTYKEPQRLALYKAGASLTNAVVTMADKGTLCITFNDFESKYTNCCLGDLNTGTTDSSHATNYYFIADGCNNRGCSCTVGYLNRDSTFAGVMERNFTLTKVGTGTWTLSGANIYTLPTRVRGGTLRVEGAVSNSTITVEAGAALGGSGTVTNVVGGTANGTTNAIFRVFAAPVKGTLKISPMTVTGTMNLSNFTLDVSSWTNLVATNTYTILTGKGVTGNFKDNTSAAAHLPNDATWISFKDGNSIKIKKHFRGTIIMLM